MSGPMRRAHLLPVLLLLLLPLVLGSSFGSARGSHCGHARDAAVDPDVGLDMFAIVKKRGYPVEFHSVTTDDGYILGVFRIPNPGHPPLFLQHGLLDSSYTWVNNFKNQSLAFILHDAGFDVWMGNNRGNTWSKRHTTFANDSKEFWDFTFDDMARYDLPAQVRYVVQKTGYEQVGYVGHSQGTTQAFASFSTYDIGKHIKLFVALAPVAFVGHQESLLLGVASKLYGGTVFNYFGIRQFLPSKTVLETVAPGLCRLTPEGCEDALFLICGVSHHVNVSRIQVYVSETPAGTSVKNIAHWGQAVRSNRFQRYDYGFLGNIYHYGRTYAPPYDLGRMNVSVALFHGAKDPLAVKKDRDNLRSHLPKDVVVADVTTDVYNHLDYVWAQDAHELIYSRVITLFKERLEGWRSSFSKEEEKNVGSKEDASNTTDNSDIVSTEGKRGQSLGVNTAQMKEHPQLRLQRGTFEESIGSQENIETALLAVD